MRHIQKPAEAPAAIRDYLLNQTPVGHGLDYNTFSQTASPLGGSRGGQLCRELTAEQFGLCAYTGAGIDNRLGVLADAEKRLRFRAHNEHVKPHSVCRQELFDAKLVPGVDLGDDMNHLNIVAALEVAGAGQGVKHSDLFGAAYRENDPISILPTDPRCEQQFDFDAAGNISAINQEGTDAISQLHLDHETLSGWRKQAVSIFVDVIASRDDAVKIIERTTIPTDGILPEYSFAIRKVIQKMLEVNSP